MRLNLGRATIAAAGPMTPRAFSQPAGTPILQFDHFYETPSAVEQQMKMRALQKKRGVPSSAGSITQSSFLLTFLRELLRYTATWPSQCVCILITTTRTELGRIALHSSYSLFLEKTSGPLGFFSTQKNKQPIKKTFFAMVSAFSQNIKNRRRVKKFPLLRTCEWTVTLVAHNIFVCAEKHQRPSTIENIRKDYRLLYFSEIVEHEKVLFFIVTQGIAPCKFANFGDGETFVCPRWSQFCLTWQSDRFGIEGSAARDDKKSTSL